MSELRNIVDIVVRLQKLERDGSKSDRMLAAMVLADLDFASKAPISEIAAKIGVSEPTVTRFCRSLGCEGVRDFKFLLAQAIAVGGQYLTQSQSTEEGRNHQVVELVAEAAIAAIRRAADALDHTVISQVATRACAAERVLCIGSGGTSSMLATEMQNRLYRLGLNTVSQVDGQLQRMFAAVAGAGTLVLAFSTSGHAQSVIDSVQVARQYGAATVAVTAPGSVLAAAAEIVVPYRTIEDGNLFKPTSSRFAMLMLVDVLATMVAEARGPKVLEGLRRIKQSLNALKIEDPHLPLGD